MIATRLLFSVLLALFCACVPARAQMATVPCIDSCSGNLRSLTTSPGDYVFAAGYYRPGDGGGGSFYVNALLPMYCPTVGQLGSWSTVSPNVITYSGTTSITAG